MHLTILYTANIQGELDLLPRLYGHISRLKRGYEGRVLLLDAGNACADEAWHCEITGGRSTLLVLDAMGYHAANASGFLTEEGRDKLADNLLKMAVIGQGDHWLEKDVLVTIGDVTPAQSHDMHIILAPDETTSLESRTLRLAAVEQGQVGIVQVSSADGNGRLAITEYTVEMLPVGILPDPTIAATVDFVLSEARYIQKRRGDASN